MCRGIVKNNLNYCEEAIVDLIDLTVKITDVVVLKKNLVYYKKSKKCMMVCYCTKLILMSGMSTLRSLNMVITKCYQKIVIQVRVLGLEICSIKYSHSNNDVYMIWKKTKKLF